MSRPLTPRLRPGDAGGARWALLVVVLGAIAPATPSPAATTRRVPEDYARIVDALYSSQSGDTVRVAAGTYSAASNGEVFPLPLYSSGVILVGAGAEVCVVDAGQINSVVRCTAAGVRVTGFTLTGGSATNGGAT